MVLGRTYFTSLIVFLLVVILFMGVAILTMPPGPGFSELYLSGPLPKEAVPGSQYTFSYGIHNLENRNMTYGYAIYIDGDMLYQGHLALADGQSASLAYTFGIGPDKANKAIPVSIRLLGTAQEVHFRVDVK